MEKNQAVVDDDDDDDSGPTVSGTELVFPKFSFMPMYRMYDYPSGGDVARKVIVLEINLPSGVGPNMYEVRVKDGGTIVELECKWPEYMLNPKKFNGKWLSGTGDGSVGPNDARLTHSVRHAQDTVREFGHKSVKSIARFFLSQCVEEKVESISVVPLGFLDDNDVPVKANGLAVQIRLLACEEIPISLYSTNEPSSFEAVKQPPTTMATNAPGSGLSGL